MQHEQELVTGDLAPGFRYCTEADARALWAVRVLDRKHARLRAERGSIYTDGPHVVALSSGRFVVIFWGSAQYKLDSRATEDAARIEAAEALVAEDPTLGIGME